MDYVSTVIGNLYIKDLHLDLSYMEIIDFSSEDFKSTPQLRDCLRNKQIEVYIPSKHPLAKKFRNRNTPQVKIIEREIKTSDNSPDLTKSLNILTEKLGSLIERIDSALVQEPPKKEENINWDILFMKLDTLASFLEKNQEDNKIDLLLKKLQEMPNKNFNQNVIMREHTTIKEKTSYNDDVPIYVPELNLDNVGKKSIKAQESSAEGTDDILAKLKKLKKGE